MNNIYVDKKPETTAINKSEDDVNLVEVRMWFRTNENIKVCQIADHDAELLKNAIVPKFVVGQKVWFTNNSKIVSGEINEFEYVISKYKESYNYFVDGYGWLLQKQLSATEEKAKTKLKELQGENDE